MKCLVPIDSRWIACHCLRGPAVVRRDPIRYSPRDPEPVRRVETGTNCEPCSMDGHDVLRRLREFSRAPVIILSARDQQSDKLKAFEAGADDYMTKPFDPREFLARIRAALRRSPAGATGTPVVRVEDLDLEIDLVRGRVRKDGKAVRLTKTELALLRVLATNPGKLLTHDYLLKTVWGAGYGGDSQYTRVYVAALRKKLGDDASSPRLILTEPGIGYRWLAEEDSDAAGDHGC